MPLVRRLEMLANDSEWRTKNHARLIQLRKDAFTACRTGLFVVALMKKRTQLTAEEERAKDRAMDFYRFIGKTELEAMRLAWEDVEKVFPRLRARDGQ